MTNPRANAGTEMGDAETVQSPSRLLAWLLLIPVLCAVAYLSSQYLIARHLSGVVETAQATVVGSHDGSGNYNPSRVTVQFVTSDGRRLTEDVLDFSWYPVPAVGDVVSVTYDPANPYYIRDSSYVDDHWVEGLAALIGFGSLLLAGFAWLRVWRSR